MGVRGRRSGSRRVTLVGGTTGVGNDPKGPCRFCGAETYGMPSLGWIFLGPRTAEYVQDGRVWACDRADCIAAFDALLDLDEADQAERRDRVAESLGNEQDGPMDDSSPTDDIKQTLMSFAAHTTRQTLFATFHEGATLYQLVRGGIQRTFWAAAYGTVGAVMGAGTGFLIGPNRGKDRDAPEVSREAVLQRKVQTTQMVRTLLPSLESLLTTTEYDARKELEHMGFYPCEHCGVPHVKGERHQMPPGTYWSEPHNAYIRPDNEEWTKEGYESASDERWDLDDDGDDGGQVH